MSEHPESQPAPEPQVLASGPGEPWRAVYFGQISQDLVPPHPAAPEAAEDELTQAALADREEVQHLPLEAGAPTLWRLVTVILVAVAALAIVFWRN